MLVIQGGGWGGRGEEGGGGGCGLVTSSLAKIIFSVYEKSVLQCNVLD